MCLVCVCDVCVRARDETPPTLQYRTVYKLCALVDIHKTLMFLCCVPYLQLSGSHAISILLRLRTKLLKQVK